jgi:broad specificity phosphatase PhoE
MTRVQTILSKLEIESGNLLIVSHQAVLRCLLTQLLGKPFGEPKNTKELFHLHKSWLKFQTPKMEM